MRRAVFLDRDGVLNRVVLRDGKPYPPASADDLELFPEAAVELARLRERGFILIVVTNQPDVARGKQTREAVEAIHTRMRESLPLDEVRVCYHDDRDGCSCRKPKPGLILDAAGEWGIDPRDSFMVGDRWRDVEAGAAAGCRTVWIDTGYRERGPAAPPDFRASDLCETVNWILRQTEGEHVRD